MNKKKKVEKSIDLAGRPLVLSTGHVAQQASGAVMVSYGETVVLATVVAAPLLEDLGYFPLKVEYQERLYAGGRIKGSRWVKREGKPSDEEVLIARLIDRSIRPLFPMEYQKDVQVIITLLSVDLENPPEIAASIATSAALAISNIPWKGPVGTTKVGLKDGELIVNPTDSQLEESTLELVVSSTDKAIIMIEAGADQVEEKQVLAGIELAQKENKKVIKLINELVDAVGQKKGVVSASQELAEVEKAISKLVKDQLTDLAKKLASREIGYPEYQEVKAAVLETLPEEERKLGGEVFEELFKKEVRKMILAGTRPDGRKLDQIRELSSQVSILPRTHGSAIFQRGQTQAMTVTTLGSPAMEQLIESAEGEESKRYIHHYSMPPYSTGETGRFGAPSRREIGHGALAEKALLPVIPDSAEFPYTIRVVTEILSCNGSTSMASTCGSTLSLMDAGVPIKAPVAGIAMGLLIEDEKNYLVLTDISGVEDGAGDMDFKVAGTKAGITALQLDVKTLNLTSVILGEAFDQAKKARLKILESMLATISDPRKRISKHAPKIKMISVPVEKIGEVIGPGGKTIKKIIAETGAQVDIDDEGKVSVSATEDQAMEAAIKQVEGLVKEVQAGEIYEGKVTRVEPYGAFVEVLPGKDGLVHVSDMEGQVQDATKVIKVGDPLKVRVREVDHMGRINLSTQMDPSKDREKRDRDRGGRRDSRGRRNYQQRSYSERSFSERRSGGYRGRDSRDNRGSRDRRDSRNPSYQRNPRSSGPHFPTSRLVNQS